MHHDTYLTTLRPNTLHPAGRQQKLRYTVTRFPSNRKTDAGFRSSHEGSTVPLTTRPICVEARPPRHPRQITLHEGPLSRAGPPARGKTHSSID